MFYDCLHIFFVTVGANHDHTSTKGEVYAFICNNGYGAVYDGNDYRFSYVLGISFIFWVNFNGYAGWDKFRSSSSN